MATQHQRLLAASCKKQINDFLKTALKSDLPEDWSGPELWWLLEAWCGRGWSKTHQPADRKRFRKFKNDLATRSIPF